MRYAFRFVPGKPPPQDQSLVLRLQSTPVAPAAPAVAPAPPAPAECPSAETVAPAFIRGSGIAWSGAQALTADFTEMMERS